MLSLKGAVWMTCCVGAFWMFRGTVPTGPMLPKDAPRRLESTSPPVFGEPDGRDHLHDTYLTAGQHVPSKRTFEASQALPAATSEASPVVDAADVLAESVTVDATRDAPHSPARLRGSESRTHL